MNGANREPRKLKSPQPCMYCGFVCDTHETEPRSHNAGRGRWYCRDADECGGRIRANKAAKGIPQDDSDLPF